MTPGRVTMNSRCESPGGAVTYIGAVTVPLYAGTVLSAAWEDAAPSSATHATHAATTPLMLPPARIRRLRYARAEEDAIRAEERAAGAAAHRSLDDSLAARPSRRQVVEPAEPPGLQLVPDADPAAPAHGAGSAPLRAADERHASLTRAGTPEPSRHVLSRLLDRAAHQAPGHAAAHRRDCARRNELRGRDNR